MHSVGGVLPEFHIDRLVTAMLHGIKQRAENLGRAPD